MIGLVSTPIWQSAPLELSVMKFVLTYEGDLRASGNRPKPQSVWDIRSAVHPQLEDLFATHPTFRRDVERGCARAVLPAYPDARGDVRSDGAPSFALQSARRIDDAVTASR